MPDLKISQLSAGGAAQAADEFPIARSGGNAKITGANIAAAATSVGTLSSLTVSGNIGIGTATPIAQLSNSSTSDSITATQPTGFVWRSTANDWSATIISRPSSGLSYALRVHSGGTSVSDFPLWISSGAGTGSQLFAITGAGNLGIGVTPSAWNSGYRALEFASGAAVWAESGSNSNIWLSSNTTFDSGGAFRYNTTAAAAAYNSQTGIHRWYIAPSGTAGNAISFTQAMTLDASGNLGVGTTPSAVAGYNVLVHSGSSGATFEQRVGTTLTGSLTTDSQMYLRSVANIPLLFGTNNTERARIDASGNFIVNTAAVATTATNGFLYVSSCAGTPTGTPTSYTGRVPIVVDTTNHKLYFYSGGTWRDAGP